jgi:hypothetical protein
MSNLNEYYTIRQSTDKALDRYNEFAKKNHWDIGGHGGKLELYSLAIQAFDSQASRPVKFEAFRTVYYTVQNWPGVQRHGRGFDPAETVFDVLVGAGRNFLYGSGHSLANLKYGSSAAIEFHEFLPKLKSLKHMAGYPHMAVSKVLHFANPGLFPIWDTKVIWDGVMRGVFRTEYRRFCGDHRFRFYENGPEFLLNYYLWAADYIQQCNDEFMDWFVNWMEREYADDLAKYDVRQELHGFYATAFEFVAIGAASLEQGEAAD